MSEQQSVWPDGARDAVMDAKVAHELRPYREEVDAILTAMEPFVQQRIEAGLSEIDEMVPPAIGIYQTIPDRVRLVIAQRDEAESIVADLRAEVARLRQERDDAHALAESRRIAEEGAREMLDHEHAERSQAESLLADADADRHRLRREVARLREDGAEAADRERRLNVMLSRTRAERSAICLAVVQEMTAAIGRGEPYTYQSASANGGVINSTRGDLNDLKRALELAIDAARSARGGEG